MILFNPDKTTQDVEDFLLQKMNLDRGKFGEEDAHIDLTLTQILNRVSESNSIAIPAHIDEYNGLSLVAESIKKEIFEKKQVPAVQVVHEKLTKKILSGKEKDEVAEELRDYYRSDGINSDTVKKWGSCAKYIDSIAQLTFSDNPNSEKSSRHGLWGIGNRYSWIKMGQEPSIESLRQAFIVPELRVKNFYQNTDPPYAEPDFWFEKISLGNTRITGREDITLAFSPQMNTIVGGRGSGKSSILRFIRGAFKKNEELKDLTSIDREFSEFYKECDKKELGVLQQNSAITIDVRKNGIRYRIEATSIVDVNNQRVDVLRYDTDLRVFEPIENEKYLSLFNFNIYSQKQIFEIASNPNALITIIDEAISGMYEKKEKISQIKKEYLSLSSRIRSNYEHLSGKERLKSEIHEIDERIKLIRKNGVPDLFLKQQQYLKENNIIQRYFTDIVGLNSFFDQLLEKLENTSFDTTKFGSEEKDSVLTIVNKLEDAIRETTEVIAGTQIEYNRKIAQLKTELSKTTWDFAKVRNTELISRKKQELGEKSVKDNSTFLKLIEEKESKEEELIRLQVIEEEQECLVDQLEKKYQKYLTLFEEVSRLRSNFLKDTIKGNTFKISVKPYKDRYTFEKELRDILQKETEFTDSINKLLDVCFTGRYPESLHKMHSDLHKLHAGEILKGYDGHFKNCIQKIAEEQYDKLILLVPKDEVLAEYKPQGSNVFKTISSASAGQKTATILTFLLSFGDNPLILDQPEDDLDNHLVYDLIVDRLKEAKENRQVIIVTHNANIPVNGDSENIIAMDSESSKLKVLYTGSIDERQIKKEICAVMEGGETAFKLRSKRYEIVK